MCIVHVDDLQVAGKPSDVTPICKNLSKKVKLQAEVPFDSSRLQEWLFYILCQIPQAQVQV